MFGLFDPPKGLPYHGDYRIDAGRESAGWRGIVYDPHGVATTVDFSANTRAAALE